MAEDPSQPPSYGSDHPPPQWPRLHLPNVNAPTEELDNRGRIGDIVTMDFDDTVGIVDAFTLSEYFAEKHIYIVQFTWGNTDGMTVDGAGIELWDSFIGISERIRQQLIDEFNVYLWVHYVSYPVMTYSHTNRRDAISPYYAWKTWGFAPPDGLDMPDWMSANDSITERNLGSADITAAIAEVVSLGGPGIENGRTALAIVNSYLTYNVTDNLGLFNFYPDTDVVAPGIAVFPDYTSGGNPDTTDNMIPQSFVEDRNTALAVYTGQDDIDQADSRPFIIDMSCRGSGTDADLLARHAEYYRQTYPVIGAHSGDYEGNGPLDPGFFPYPRVSENLWNYFVENFQNGGYRGSSIVPTSGAPPSIFNSREGGYEDVDVAQSGALIPFPTPNIRSYRTLANYDGLVGEVPVWASFAGPDYISGTTIGNPGFPANRASLRISTGQGPGISSVEETFGVFSLLPRDNPKAAIHAAQVIWADWMKGKRFALRGYGVKNLVAVSDGVLLDFDGNIIEKGPAIPGVFERPVAILTWESNWPNDVGETISNPDSESEPFSTYLANLPMAMWEVRWALDEATLKAGDGTRVNYIQTSTGGYDGLDFPASGAKIAASHNQPIPTEVFFTVIENNIYERGGYGGKMIHEHKNRGRSFDWVDVLYSDRKPPYTGCLDPGRFFLDQDFRNVRHESTEITVVSVMMDADPEAPPPP